MQPKKILIRKTVLFILIFIVLLLYIHNQNNVPMPIYRLQVINENTGELTTLDKNEPITMSYNYILYDSEKSDCNIHYKIMLNDTLNGEYSACTKDQIKMDMLNGLNKITFIFINRNKNVIGKDEYTVRYRTWSRQSWNMYNVIVSFIVPSDERFSIGFERDTCGNPENVIPNKIPIENLKNCFVIDVPEKIKFRVNESIKIRYVDDKPEAESFLNVTYNLPQKNDTLPSGNFSMNPDGEYAGVTYVKGYGVEKNDHIYFIVTDYNNDSLIEYLNENKNFYVGPNYFQVGCGDSSKTYSTLVTGIGGYFGSFLYRKNTNGIKNYTEDITSKILSWNEDENPIYLKIFKNRRNGLKTIFEDCFSPFAVFDFNPEEYLDMNPKNIKLPKGVMLDDNYSGQFGEFYAVGYPTLIRGVEAYGIYQDHVLFNILETSNPDFNEEVNSRKNFDDEIRISLGCLENGQLYGIEPELQYDIMSSSINNPITLKFTTIAAYDGRDMDVNPCESNYFVNAYNPEHLEKNVLPINTFAVKSDVYVKAYANISYDYYDSNDYPCFGDDIESDFCFRKKQVSIRILENNNPELLRSIAQDEQIYIGCMKNDSIYYNYYDSQSKKESFVLSAKLSGSIINSTKSKPITLRLRTYGESVEKEFENCTSKIKIINTY